MRVLIAGGTGLLGRAFTARLLHSGHQVWVLSRSPQSARVPAGATVVKWDARTPRGWQELVGQVDAVANLAGENLGAGLWTASRKKRILESRVHAGQAIVAACEQAVRRPRVLLQASAVGYYGPTADQLLDETSPPGTDFLAQVCVAWEGATQPVEALGVRRVIIRTGLVLTPEGGFLPPVLLQFRLFAGGPIGNGMQWWPWIHLQDQLAAMEFLLLHETASGAYNLCAPNPVRMKDFGRELARALRRPYWLPAPAFVLRLLLGEMSLLVVGGQRVVPKRLLEAGYRFQFEQLGLALKDVVT
jgi:uncharacterized protein (TIGR01777 family)